MIADKILKKAENQPGFLDYLAGSPLAERKTLLKDFFKDEIGNNGTIREIIYHVIEKEHQIEIGGCPDFKYNREKDEAYCTFLKNRPACGLVGEICRPDDGWLEG